MAESLLSRSSERTKALLRSELGRWVLASLCTSLLGLVAIKVCRRTAWTWKTTRKDAAATDPGLLKKGTTFEQYKTPSGHVYPKIRTFYSAHPQAKKLPEDLPLLVFVHGLGGSTAQFVPLLTTLVNIATCLAVDLPGCGLSSFEPANTEAYTTTAFAELLSAAIDKFRNKEIDQKVVLVGHSMGCSISALLASSSSPLVDLCSSHITGMVAICPRASPLSRHDLQSIARLSRIPSTLFDLMRLLDRRGGVDSVSVQRVVGRDADLETRKLQLRYNQQSKSAVFQRFCLGMYLMETQTAKGGEDSLLGQRVWSGIKIPLFLVGAENDNLAPPKIVEQIAAWLTAGRDQDVEKSMPNADVQTPLQTEAEIAPDELQLPAYHDQPLQPSTVAGDAQIAQEQLTNFKASSFSDRSPSLGTPALAEETASTKHFFALKTLVFPAPASHGLLYATADVRILSGLIENFLAKYVDQRLSPGWQLQHLTTSGKWDVKNLAKWQSVEACSEPIAGVFRAMKTMREIDDEHCPKHFVSKFGFPTRSDGVIIVVDISHDSPVYDKNRLEEGGIEYHKFPTVSKLPPTADEVEHFVSLIDELRRSPKLQEDPDKSLHPMIGVHCHYGFNRTGFFIVCYMVERLGYSLHDAVEEFAAKRSPGIKHEYFISELYVRYAVKMERRGTMIG